MGEINEPESGKAHAVSAVKVPSNAGRPTVLDDILRSKIEEAAALGATIEEIAYYTGVHRTTLYRWMRDNEELRYRIEELQERPILKARQTIVTALSNPDNAQWFIERKRRKEFATRAELGTDEEGFTVNILYGEGDTNRLLSATASAVAQEGADGVGGEAVQDNGSGSESAENYVQGEPANDSGDGGQAPTDVSDNRPDASAGEGDSVGRPRGEEPASAEENGGAVPSEQE